MTTSVIIVIRIYDLEHVLLVLLHHLYYFFTLIHFLILFFSNLNTDQNNV